MAEPEQPQTEHKLPGMATSVRQNSDMQQFQTLSEQLSINQRPNKHEDYESHVQEIYNNQIQKENQVIGGNTSLLHDVLNIDNVLTDGISSIIDDSFYRCFTTNDPDPWNWNFYLFPLWLVGVIVRYVVIFPIRVMVLFFGLAILFAIFFPIKLLLPSTKFQRKVERKLVSLMAGVFVTSWTGVIKVHGPRPTFGANRVWVSNHTSMIDYTVLCALSPFAVIMQLHGGWVGVLQKYVLDAIGCLNFDRTEAKDRDLTLRRMREHVADPNKEPLLIFPEGTCVNNEYTVMFKRGAFDLGATVCPVAIKYNKIFVDAFWNSKKTPFTKYILKLMTSWALVADLYFLEPQVQQEGETTTQFAERVQQMIASAAGLTVVPWDGYLKYYNLGKKHPHMIEERRKVLCEKIKRNVVHTTIETSTPTTSAQDTAHGDGLRKR